MVAAHDSQDAFGSNGPNARGRSEYGELRDARELRSFFRDLEATVGFRSTFSAMLAAASGVAMGSGPPAGWDPYADIVDQIRHGAIVRRTLASISSSHVVVLFRLYGPEPARAFAGASQLGDLAGLAPYTRAAEEARDAYVVRVSIEQEPPESIPRTDIETEFWRVAGRLLTWERRIDWHEAQLAKNPDRESSKVALARLHPKHAALEEFAGRLLDAFMYDGTLRARLGSMASTDRAVSTEDAIADRLDQRRPLDQRSEFIVAVKRECAVLRTAAHEAYRFARERVTRESKRCLFVGPSYDRETGEWTWPETQR